MQSWENEPKTKTKHIYCDMKCRSFWIVSLLHRDAQRWSGECNLLWFGYSFQSFVSEIIHLKEFSKTLSIYNALSKTLTTLKSQNRIHMEWLCLWDHSSFETSDILSSHLFQSTQRRMLHPCRVEICPNNRIFQFFIYSKAVGRVNGLSFTSNAELLVLRLLNFSLWI